MKNKFNNKIFDKTGECTWQMKNFHFYLQKEEMGEVLHEVDFNQLKIENQQYLEKIDEKNQDLLRLKLMSTNVQQILNTYKVKKSSFDHISTRMHPAVFCAVIVLG